MSRSREFVFDMDTQMVGGGGVYTGTVQDRWNVGTVPNGGYMLALAMQALRSESEVPDPLSITAHYLRPGRPGPVEARVQAFKQGRNYSNWTASLLQEGKECLRCIAVYGDLTRMAGPHYVDALPPEVPERIEANRRRIAGGPQIHRMFEQYLAPNFTFADPPNAEGHAEIRAAIAFADGRPIDTHCLGLMADSVVPAVFLVTERGWVPTLELTVHVRARPTSRFLNVVFRTRFLSGGLLEEDGEMWDESGVLVAQSRQLAGAPRLP